MRHIDLTEWQRASAGPDHPALQGLYLDDPAIADGIRWMVRSNALVVSEGRHGLVVETRQHVGVVRVGPMQIRVRPKMAMPSLWAAIAYGLGLDGIALHDPSEIAVGGDFADLLSLMLLREAERLWRLGIRRGYDERAEWLAAPRGRPDLVTLARSGPLTRASLPCRHHAFTSDVIDNQVVLAGLGLAADAAVHLPLRGALQRVRQQWATACSSRPLSLQLLDQAERGRNRLNQRYAGVHRLVRLLYEGSGPDDAYDRGETRLPGFLWNMATLFERFVARFLTEHLPDHEVLAQGTLHALYSVVCGRPGLAAPRPRPDLVVRRRSDGAAIGVYDTKYRDLWGTTLPREILYQMSVYAMGWGESEGKDVPAVVLYPSLAPRPDVELRLQVAHARPRRILLRAVEWARAAEFIVQRDETGAKTLARRWVGTQGAVATIQQAQTR